MKRGLGIVVLSGLLLSPVVGHTGGIAVFDAVAELRSIIEFEQQVMEYAKLVEQVENQLTMIQNQKTQIEHLYTTVQQGATNLTKLRLSTLQDVLSLGRQLQSKLDQAKYIGYQVDNVWDQARGVYGELHSVTSADDMKALALRWAGVQRNGAQVAIQTQALQSDAKVYQAKWTQVLQAAEAAEGNMQVQQAQAQGQALLGSELGSIKQILATDARMKAEERLEKASRMELDVATRDQATKTLDTSGYIGEGRLIAVPRSMGY